MRAWEDRRVTAPMSAHMAMGDGTSRRSGMVAHAMPMGQKTERLMQGVLWVCNSRVGDGYVPLRPDGRARGRGRTAPWSDRRRREET
jgi:hypothetical protein